jgi:hypothetical protein
LFSIANAIWDDEDGDGVRDPGEAGIGGVTVALRDSGGSLIGTALTDANGNFQFSGLGNGNYTIDLTDTSGVLTNLQPTTAAATAGQLAVTVAGANISAVSFGYRSLGTIGEVVWSDSDGDGVRDPSEPGIGGVTVRIIISGLDGLFGTPDDAVIATTTTAIDGTYRFTGLPQAYYRVHHRHWQRPGGVYTDRRPRRSRRRAERPMLAGVDLSMNFGYRTRASAACRDHVRRHRHRRGSGHGEAGSRVVWISSRGPTGFGTITTTSWRRFSDRRQLQLPRRTGQRLPRQVTDVGNVLNSYTLTSGLDQIP